MLRPDHIVRNHGGGTAGSRSRRLSRAIAATRPGRRTQMAIGREVRAGDILVELDSEPQKLELQEQRARLGVLFPEMKSLQAQIAAEERAGSAEREAALSAIEEARAQVRRSDAPARLAEAELERIGLLQKEGLIAERDVERARALALEQRADTEGRQLSIQRLQQEQRTRESDRDARVRQILTGIARIEGQTRTTQSAIARLEYEIERRRIRAPISGRIAEAAVLRTGAVVDEAEKLGSIVPSGQLAVVAHFPPPAAIGRIRTGQPARVRLAGFPWMEYGAVNAVVSDVANEIRDGAARVELKVLPSQKTPIPLQHGLAGSVEVEVERTTPLALVLRTVGQWITEPRSPFSLQGQ